MPLDLFSKTPIPTELPNTMSLLVSELKQSANQAAGLRWAYDVLSARFEGNRIKTYTRLFDVFEQDINKIWNQTGYLHCTNINFLLRVALVKSGLFTENDIRLRWTQIWFFSPHQYLQIKIEDRWIDVDIWARTYGIEFGDHTHGLH